MWIGDIDVPQPVLDAAEAGTFALFVGAGASRAAPSDLPDFKQLVRNIGALVGRNPTDDEVRHPDVFLGRLRDSGNDVHQLVANAIDLPDSQPNALHHAIVRLAGAYPNPRVVTTNYDRHLTSAASAHSLGLDVYQAPALPVGDDFEGVVHLHGSLTQFSRRLVVTDTDFGRAYLREAWAARFLERMFSAFTVLFIGYSHGDVVMQYLARSLGPNHNRYVLTDDEQNAEWRRLGLAPISYPNDEGNHSALPASLERWRELATMGQVEHRTRLADLLSAEPPTIPEEVSYVEAALEHPERIRYFAEKARFNDRHRRQRWFAWIEGRRSFLGLFSQDSASEPTSRTLMAWLADQYVVSEEGSAIALRAFRDKLWPPDTWYVITQAIFAYKGAFPNWLNPWLQLVLQNAPTRQHDMLDMMLVDKDWSTNFDLALTVFKDRTRPQLKRAPDFGGGNDQPRFEVDLCGDEYWLTDSWTKIFLPVLDQHFAQLLSLTTEQISSAYRSLRGLDPDSSFDPISFSRSAIEHHEQDDFRKPVDVLIDAARDSIEVALSDSLPIAAAYLEVWCSSPHAIFRRLAAHGWRVRSDVSADDKLNWLLRRNLLWESPLHHEVFQLIRDALAGASDPVALQLVDAATAGPPSDDDEYSRYRSYNLLGWLASSAPDLQAAVSAFEHAQSAHPEYRRTGHDDFSHYGVSGVVEDALPFTAAEFHEMVGHDPAAALTSLRAFQTETHALKGPTWTGALHSLQACVSTYPEDGVKISQVLQDADRDLWTSIIRGWDGATLTDPLVDRVLAIIAGWDHDEVRRPAASMLSNGGAPDHPTAWHQHESARRLATELWPTADIEGALLGGADIVMEAINHPAGDLAEFWTKVVQWEWTRSESTWDGLPVSIVRHLDQMISAPDRNGLLARTILGSQLHFFFGADREWCEARLLPLFDWTNEVEAAAAWQGFLTWGRWNDGLLQAGLLNGYAEAVVHADQLPDDLRGRLAGHHVSITMFAAVDPKPWLTRFVLGASEDLRVTWARQVEHALAQIDSRETTNQWERWVLDYWAGRNRSVPRPFTPAEASATASWVLALSGVRDQAIDLVLGSEASLVQHGGLLYRLQGLDVAAEAKDWARLVTHLLKNTSGQQWGVGYRLQEIVAQLREANPPPDLTDLINEAMRLGVTSAGDW
ncbi:MAG TPA: SIR2 family protein [Microlunatus sp.]